MKPKTSGHYTLGEACRFAQELYQKGIEVLAILPLAGRDSIVLHRWYLVYIADEEQHPSFPIET